MVERMKLTIQDMLAKYVAEHQRDWDVHLHGYDGIPVQCSFLYPRPTFTRGRAMGNETFYGDGLTGQKYHFQLWKFS